MVFETIAFASLATPAVRKLYPSAFGTDKGVEVGNVAATGHGNVAWRCLGPMDSELVEGSSEDSKNVGRGIREHVAGVAIDLRSGSPSSRDPVDVAIAVRMDETSNEGLGVLGGDVLLPVGEFDLPEVLPAGAVLWKEAGPVLPVCRHLNASLQFDKANPVYTPDDDDVACDLVDDVRVPEVAGNSQSINISRVGREATIAQVYAKQIGVRLGVEPTTIATKTLSNSTCPRPRAGTAATAGCDPDSPITNGSSRNLETASDLAVVDSRPDQFQSP
jgi:hypothetical protein